MRSKSKDYNQVDIDRLRREGEKLKHDRSLLQKELTNTEDEAIRKELNERIEELSRDIRLLTERIGRIMQKNKS